MKTKKVFAASLGLTALLTITAMQSQAQSWSTTGNAGIAAGTNYLGTSDSNDLVLRTNAIEKGRLFANGTWRFGNATNSMQVDNTGNLSFAGLGEFRVSGNKYVFRYNATNLGMYLNTTSNTVEYRNAVGATVFSVGANTGNGIFTGTLQVGTYTLPATDGAANQVLKTNGAGALAWSNDNNTTYTAGTGLSLVGTTFSNTAPDQTVTLAGTNGVSISGAYPNFTASGGGLWSTTGNTGTSAATNFVGTTDGQPIVFRTNNTERMRLGATNGRLGMGTTAPTAILHINAPAAEDALRVQTAGTTRLFVDNGGGVSIGSASAGPAGGLYVSGNVGIGNIAPTNKLDVSGAAAFTGIVGIRGATNASYALNVNASSSYDGINVTDPVNNYILNCTKSGDNIGIYVNKTSTTSGTATIYSANAGTGPGIYAYNSSSGYGVYASSSSGIGVRGISTSNYGVSGYSTSDYGVYGYSADYRGAYVEGDPAYYSLYVNGDTYTTGTYFSSDAKLKKNIKDVNNAMDIINQLRPKNYEFRNDGNYSLMNLPKGNHYGLIAQDVEKILPNLVKEEPFNTKDAKPNKPNTDGKEESITAEKNEAIDFKAVNYTELIPILVKALQEQDAKIETLTKELNEMKQTQSVSGSTQSTNITTSAIVSNASLGQNIPNPLTNTTAIQYSVPANVRSAQMLITDNSGKTIKQIQLAKNTNGTINIDASALSSGTYSYTLIVDGKIIDTKKMVVAK